MLTIVGAIGEPSYIHIYDTPNLGVTESKSMSMGLRLETAAWTAEDKIMVWCSFNDRDIWKNDRWASHPSNTRCEARCRFAIVGSNR